MDDDTPTGIAVTALLAGLVPAAWWAWFVIVTFDWHASTRLNGLWVFAIAIGGFFAWVVTGQVVAKVLSAVWSLLGRAKR